MQAENEKMKVFGNGILHPGARPMEVYLDKEGCLWLCDKGIDSSEDFGNQGCWRCQDLQFTRND